MVGNYEMQTWGSLQYKDPCTNKLSSKSISTLKKNRRRHSGTISLHSVRNEGGLKSWTRKQMLVWDMKHVVSRQRIKTEGNSSFANDSRDRKCNSRISRNFISKAWRMGGFSDLSVIVLNVLVPSLESYFQLVPYFYRSWSRIKEQNFN